MPEPQRADAHRHRTPSRTTWVLLGFLAVAGFFLFTEHRAHLLGILPWLLLLACPLMHLFMHHGHGGHAPGGGEVSGKEKAPRQEDEP